MYGNGFQRKNNVNDSINLIDIKELKIKPIGIIFYLMILGSPGFLYLLISINIVRELAVIFSFMYLFLVITSYLYYETRQFYLFSDKILHSGNNDNQRYFILKRMGKRAKLEQIERNLNKYIIKNKMHDSVIPVLISMNSLGEITYSHTKIKTVKFYYKNGYRKEDYDNDIDDHYKILISKNEVDLDNVYKDSFLNGVLFPKEDNIYLFIEVEQVSIYESFVGSKLIRFIHRKLNKNDRILLLGNTAGIIRFLG